MDHRPFGQTGPEVSAIGCWEVGGESDAIFARHALTTTPQDWIEDA